MRVLVCGGRNYGDIQKLYEVLDAIRNRAPHDAMVVIQGGATGADYLARQWAMDRCVPYENYPADWKKYGRSAGPLRNDRMIAVGRPDLVVAFPGGRGTADMVRRAHAAEITVYNVETETTLSHHAPTSG